MIVDINYPVPEGSHDAHSPSVLLRLQCALRVLFRGSGRGKYGSHVLILEEGTEGIALGIHHPTQIDELDVAVLMQKHVVRLEVAVHEPHLMEVDQR